MSRAGRAALQVAQLVVQDGHRDVLVAVGVLQLVLPLAQQRDALDRASYAAGRIDLGTALQSSIALAEAEIDVLDREAEVAHDGVRIKLTYQGNRP